MLLFTWVGDVLGLIKCSILHLIYGSIGGLFRTLAMQSYTILSMSDSTGKR